MEEHSFVEARLVKAIMPSMSWNMMSLLQQLITDLDLLVIIELELLIIG